MGLISITATDPEELFKRPEAPVLKAGKHLFVVANKLQISVAESSGNKVIKLEARCQDNDEGKGLPIFHNFVIIDNPQNEKQLKSKKIQDAQLAQFTASCDVLTPDQIKAGAQIDLDAFEGKFFNAVTAVAMEDVYPAELGEDGKPKKSPRARIKQFLFDQPK